DSLVARPRGKTACFCDVRRGAVGEHGCMTANPTFLVVDDDGDTVQALHSALQRRFGVDYDIRAAQSVYDGLAVLEAVRDRAEPVAVVIADLVMPGMACTPGCASCSPSG